MSCALVNAAACFFAKGTYKVHRIVLGAKRGGGDYKVMSTPAR